MANTGEVKKAAPSAEFRHFQGDETDGIYGTPVENAGRIMTCRKALHDYAYTSSGTFSLSPVSHLGMDNEGFFLCSIFKPRDKAKPADQGSAGTVLARKETRAFRVDETTELQGPSRGNDQKFMACRERPYQLPSSRSQVGVFLNWDLDAVAHCTVFKLGDKGKATLSQGKIESEFPQKEKILDALRGQLRRFFETCHAAETFKPRVGTLIRYEKSGVIEWKFGVSRVEGQEQQHSDALMKLCDVSRGGDVSGLNTITIFEQSLKKAGIRFGRIEWIECSSAPDGTAFFGIRIHPSRNR